MFLIARRYLLSPKSHSVVNIICGVSLFSLLLPVAAVVILLSVFNGFGDLVCELEGAIEADVTIRLREGKHFDTEEIAPLALDKIEGIASTTFVTEQMLMLRNGENSTLLTMRGVDSSYRDVIEIEPFITSGKWQVELGDLDRMVVGGTIATKLKVWQLNSTPLELMALRTGALQSYIPTGRYNTANARMAGVVSLDEASEQKYGYTSRRLINRLLSRDSVATKMLIRLEPQANVAKIKRAIIEQLDEWSIGDKYLVQSRAELNPTLYNIVRYEKLGIILISTLVMLLASFSLLGALAMLILEKRSEQLTIRMMGATQSDIERIFLMQGWLISGLAIVLGLLLGSAVSLIQQHFGIIELPTSSMMVNIYPVRVAPMDLIIVAAIATIISSTLCYATVKRMVRK